MDDVRRKMTQLKLILANLNNDADAYVEEWAKTNNNADEIETLLEQYTSRKSRTYKSKYDAADSTYQSDGGARKSLSRRASV